MAIIVCPPHLTSAHLSSPRAMFMLTCVLVASGTVAVLRLLTPPMKISESPSRSTAGQMVRWWSSNECELRRVFLSTFVLKIIA